MEKINRHFVDRICDSATSRGQMPNGLATHRVFRPLETHHIFSGEVIILETEKMGEKRSGCLRRWKFNLGVDGLNET